MIRRFSSSASTPKIPESDRIWHIKLSKEILGG
jgi:hypothetical protein